MREQKSTREEAANAAVSMAKTFDDSIRICGWTVQCWAKHFMHHGAPPTSRRGLHQKTASLIHDEDVVSKCLQWLRLTLPSQRTPFRVQQHRQEHVLPSTTGAIRANVSLRTAERWMNKAGYFYGLAKKDVYIDGHERADVVKQRGEFCQTWIMMSQRMSFYAGENMKEHFAPEDTSQPEVVWITHDESIFYANDNGGKVWLSQSCPDLGKKGRGRSIMVSDFLCPCHGRLHDGKEFVTAILHVGKTHEGYWTSEHAIHQLKSKVLPAFTQLHPGKVAMFTFDQSTNHAAFAPDAWRASNMNLHSGGKQGLLRDGWLGNDRVVQNMVMSNGHAKGLKAVLTERGIDCSRMLLQCKSSIDIKSTKGVLKCCARHCMASHDDFRQQLSVLEETISQEGHICLFFPKYYCELNPIEPFWGAAKRLTRVNCDYSWLGLVETVPESLNRVALSSIRKYFRRCGHFIEAYNYGCDYKLSQYAHKIYKSHRRIPVGILNDVDK
ncbi:hypothetical protein Ae201684P_010618 [Aphanomyces euteiches]|nr:hypothetical protein Ae201684P_010618 [Aphanomyces euteiches]